MKVLIIEDEQELSDSIVSYLAQDHYRCEQAFNYNQALEKIALYQYDCILLDLTLPGGDGLSILREIKQRKLKSGVIIISARDSINDKVEGLKIGADDYLAKPFHLSELSIRIYALVRRQQFLSNNLLDVGELSVNLLTKQVFIHKQEVVLTKSEYELLLFLIGNRNRVVSKNAIAEHLSGDMADMLSNLDFVYAHIKNLKSKLSEKGCTNCIKTVYGLGYQWIEG